MFPTVLTLCVLIMLLYQVLRIPIASASKANALQDLEVARLSGNVLIETDFKQGGMEDWVVEGPGHVAIQDGAMRIRSLGQGSTIWHKKRLDGNVLIEFVATIDPPVAAANLNVFVHATDPTGRPVYEGNRSGAYAEYHELPLYIFTYTGDQGREGAPGYARFRKDPGFVLLAENGDFKAVTGETYKISILIEGERFRYYIDDRLVHDYTDPDPYRSGWFAFRTWNTNLTIVRLVIKQLEGR